MRRELIVLAATAALVAGCGKGGQEQAKESSLPGPGGTAGPSGAVARPDSLRVKDAGPGDIPYLREMEPTAQVEVALGTAFIRKAEPESALVHLRRATGMDPENLAAWNLIGIVQSRRGNLNEAQAALEKATTIDAFDITTHINLGNVYLRAEKLDQAVAEYKIATTIDSTDALTWENLGIAYAHQGKDNDAIYAYDQAIKFAPDSASPWERLGNLYARGKFYKAALESYQEVLKRDPSREDIRKNVESLQAYADSLNSR